MKFEIVGDDISDGHHTFTELYDHRVALYIRLLNETDYECSINKDRYEGWDAIYLELPEGQISYHIPSHFRHMLPDRIVDVTQGDSIYDGHASDDVLNRLIKKVKSRLIIVI